MASVTVISFLSLKTVKAHPLFYLHMFLVPHNQKQSVLGYPLCLTIALLWPCVMTIRLLLTVQSVKCDILAGRCIYKDKETKNFFKKSTKAWIFAQIIILFISFCVNCLCVGWVKLPNAYVSAHQGTGEQSRAHTCPSHLLGRLILHSSPWQGNEPRRVTGSPHVTTMMGAYGRVQRATEDHALWDQARLCLNYRPGPGPLGALTAP